LVCLTDDDVDRFGLCMWGAYRGARSVSATSARVAHYGNCWRYRVAGVLQILYIYGAESQSSASAIRCSFPAAASSGTSHWNLVLHVRKHELHDRRVSRHRSPSPVLFGFVVLCQPLSAFGCGPHRALQHRCGSVKVARTYARELFLWDSSLYSRIREKDPVGKPDGRSG